MEFFGEPDIAVNSPPVSTKGGLFGLRHANNQYLLCFGDVKTSIPFTKAAFHYLIGSRSFGEPDYGIWQVRNKSDIIERKEADIVSTKNLGESSLEAVFDGKKYHSEGIRRPWSAYLI